MIYTNPPPVEKINSIEELAETMYRYNAQRFQMYLDDFVEDHLRDYKCDYKGDDYEAYEEQLESWAVSIEPAVVIADEDFGAGSRGGVDEL